MFFTTVNNFSQSCFTWIQSTVCRPVSESQFLILFSHSHLGPPCDLIPSVSPPKSCMHFSSFSVCHIAHPHNPPLGYTDDIQCCVYIHTYIYINHGSLREVINSRIFFSTPFSKIPSLFSFLKLISSTSIPKTDKILSHLCLF